MNYDNMPKSHEEDARTQIIKRLRSENDTQAAKVEFQTDELGRYEASRQVSDERIEMLLAENKRLHDVLDNLLAGTEAHLAEEGRAVEALHNYGDAWFQCAIEAARREFQLPFEPDTRLVDVLSYFVCHWPAGTKNDELFDDMFSQAMALTGMLPEGDVLAQDGVTGLSARDAAITPSENEND